MDVDIHPTCSDRCMHDCDQLFGSLSLIRGNSGHHRMRMLHDAQIASHQDCALFEFSKIDLSADT